MPYSDARDIITNFKKEDQIDLSSIKQTQDSKPMTSLEYIGDEEFSGMNPEVRFENEILEINLNNDYAPDMSLHIKGVGRLSSSSLILD